MISRAIASTIILTVVDKQRCDNYSFYPKYINLIVITRRYRNIREFYDIRGIIKVEE